MGQEVPFRNLCVFLGVSPIGESRVLHWGFVLFADVTFHFGFGFAKGQVGAFKLVRNVFDLDNVAVPLEPID